VSGSWGLPAQLDLTHDGTAPAQLGLMGLSMGSASSYLRSATAACVVAERDRAQAAIAAVKWEP
jgi:hypothetical protein